MKHLFNWNSYLFEGVSVDGDGYKFDFSGDKPGDIMSLSFSNKRTVTRKNSGVPYSYYYAYEFDSQNDKNLLKAVKMLDDRIDPEKAKLMVNKAVMGLNKNYQLNTFDTIVYPKSGSIVLKEMAKQANDKSGNALMVPDAFVKADRSDIKFDMEKIDKLPEKTKKQVLKMIDNIKNSDGEFKLKEIYARNRKFIKDFVIFNSEDDRRTHNAIAGKKVLLIDDYRTTGTTLKEMMSQLVKLGPSEIVVFLMIKVV
jgi:hypothetical protein